MSLLSQLQSLRTFLFSGKLSAKTRAKQQAITLYAHIMAAARRPIWYQAHGIPDTTEGRFDWLLLLSSLVFLRLKALLAETEGRVEDSAIKMLEKELVTLQFDDIDQVLRAEGIGDMSVAKHLKKAQMALHGRMQALSKAFLLPSLEGGDVALKEAIVRNLPGDFPAEADAVEALAQYVRQTYEHLQSLEAGAFFKIDSVAFENKNLSKSLFPI